MSEVSFMRVEITDEMIERAARALYDHHVERGGKVASDEWDFGPAEYMRHLFRVEARAAITAAFNRVERREYGVLER